MAEEPPAELESFCRAEWPRLVGSLCLMTGDIELAKELAQETMARICRDWRRVGGMDAPGAWAHRVAMNLARSHFRRRTIAQRWTASLAARTATEHAPPDMASAVALRAAVAELPERQRAAIILRYFADLPVRDVAQAIGCPEGTVKTLTREAIRTLRAGGLIDDDELTAKPPADVV